MCRSFVGRIRFFLFPIKQYTGDNERVRFRNT